MRHMIRNTGKQFSETARWRGLAGLHLGIFLVVSAGSLHAQARSPMTRGLTGQDGGQIVYDSNNRGKIYEALLAAIP
jgi:hypothetical protein